MCRLVVCDSERSPSAWFESVEGTEGVRDADWRRVAGMAEKKVYQMVMKGRS